MKEESGKKPEIAIKDASGKKPEITIKKNPTLEAIKRAPDEAIAMAIHDAILKEHEKLDKVDQ